MKLSKKIRSLVIFTISIFSVSAQASAWLNCEVLARVEEVRNMSIINGSSLQEMKILLIRNPFSCEGHSIPNKLSKGQSLWVRISIDNPARITVNTEIKFKREIYYGMGPNGFIESDEWSVLEIIK